MTKCLKRIEYLARRKQLSAPTWRRLSQLVQQRLVAAEFFQQAQALALYSSVNNEVDTDLLLSTALATGKRVFYPRVCKLSLEFLEVLSRADLEQGAFGIAEPVAGEPVAVTAIDLIVVPGLAFDLRGHRLGYGKGFYDRELARVTEKTISVGLGFDFQFCPVLPNAAHDRSLDYLISEHKLISCRESAGST